ncbi:MAG: amidohydrolase family protein, partial [Chloroflexota bacterium]
ERNITTSVAHTAATYEEVVHAAERGLSHSTHTFNAMSGLHHRNPGTVGAVMNHPNIRCELIADNIHVHPAAMRLLWNAKNFQNVVLITDAVRAAGMPDGDYAVDERTINVTDGVATLPDGTLAGSTLTMDRALKNFAAATRSALDLVYEAATIAPAEAAGIDDVTGSITEGKEADLVLLDDAYNVLMTVARGEVVYERL